MIGNKTFAAATLFAALSGSAWAECPPGVYDPRIGCDPAPWTREVQFPTPGIKDPSTPPEVMPVPPVPPLFDYPLILNSVPSDIVYLATITDDGTITFNWPAIEKCATDTAKRDADDQTVMNCKIWLAARRDGEARPK